MHPNQNLYFVQHHVRLVCECFQNLRFAPGLRTRQKWGTVTRHSAAWLCPPEWVFCCWSDDWLPPPLPDAVFEGHCLGHWDVDDGWATSHINSSCLRTTSATIGCSISKPLRLCSRVKCTSYDVVGVTKMTRFFRVCSILAITSCVCGSILSK